LKEQNAKFAKLSNAQKRVAVATDVIASLKLKLFRPVHCTISSDVHKKDLSTAQEIACEIASGTVDCVCCAVGSLVTCMVGIGRTPSEILNDDYNDMGIVINYLEKFWPKWNLMAIEIAYEENDGAFTAPEKIEYRTRQDAIYDECKFIHKNNDEEYKWAGYHIDYDLACINTHKQIDIVIKAKKFAESYSDDQEVLIAIMENVIKNKGLFIL
jgi:hypothetical protein